MAAFIVAIVCIGAALFAVLPVEGFPGWGAELLAFMKGLLPFLGFLAGFIALLVGIADTRDKIMSSREEKKNKPDDAE